ncbi:Undecaprenyl-diphosphatase [Candidatus Bealeia paramacronuclearis]|uniref:Undecaprenyl-diphosphatase n=1 Tax=Candidatus Bealeia paramacronuclearis TaxID=1921001 RepID=A0ABZ2C7L5_9PROT|nr:Undecaprenyl-diphosphatase [Candidatus Bealeia paramacronuclearis]
MPLEQIITLAIVQGLTEFLPVSSSGHLALTPVLFGWKDQGLMMDVAAHMGTLGSVLVYFWRDVLSLIQAPFDLLKGKQTQNTRLLFNLIVATIPVVIAGFLFDKLLGDSLRSVEVIAWAGILFGLVMYTADHSGKLLKTEGHIGIPQAFIFGLAQCLALINGTSRSGITMTAGRFMNFKRVDAARFAFLMSIPAIGAAGVLKGIHLIKEGDTALFADAALMASFSFLSGLAAIVFMMNWLKKSTLTPFVIYRLILGVGLLGAVYGGYF